MMSTLDVIGMEPKSPTESEKMFINHCGPIDNGELDLSLSGLDAKSFYMDSLDCDEITYQIPRSDESVSTALAFGQVLSKIGATLVSENRCEIIKSEPFDDKIIDDKIISGDSISSTKSLRFSNISQIRLIEYETSEVTQKQATRVELASFSRVQRARRLVDKILAKVYGNTWFEQTENYFWFDQLVIEYLTEKSTLERNYVQILDNIFTQFSTVSLFLV